MSAKRSQLIQLILEAALPLYGIIFWNWSLAFLLFYYVFDWLANTVLTALKIRKIVSFQEKPPVNSKWTIRIILALAFVAPTFLFGYKLLLQIDSNFDLWKSFRAFFFYKDMGLPQGYFLVPLIAFSAWSQYRMKFLMTQRFKTTNQFLISNAYLVQNAFILGGTMLCFIESKIFLIPEISYAFFLIGASCLFRFFKRY